jgi:hypothetical protein
MILEKGSANSPAVARLTKALAELVTNTRNITPKKADKSYMHRYRTRIQLARLR